jgi:hypothetical protein
LPRACGRLVQEVVIYLSIQAGRAPGREGRGLLEARRRVNVIQFWFPRMQSCNFAGTSAALLRAAGWELYVECATSPWIKPAVYCRHPLPPPTRVIHCCHPLPPPTRVIHCRHPLVLPTALIALPRYWPALQQLRNLCCPCVFADANQRWRQALKTDHPKGLASTAGRAKSLSCK